MHLNLFYPSISSHVNSLCWQSILSLCFLLLLDMCWSLLKDVLWPIATSWFDVFSDLTNALDLLGVSVSNPSNDNETVTANVTVPSIDIIWGCCGLGIMFLPGLFLTLTPYVFMKGTRLAMKTWQTKQFEYLREMILTLLGLIFFPVSVFLLQLLSLLICADENSETRYKHVLATLVAAEAYFESFPQILLQLFTIINGRGATGIQIVCMSASFVFLAKTSIGFDMGAYNIDLKTWKDKIAYHLRVLPLYTTCCIFRCMSFALTFSYLRYWSIIPTVAYVLAMMLITAKVVSFDVDIVYALTLSNMGMVNVGMVQSDIYNKELPDGLKEDLPKRLQRYLKVSTIFTFIFHTACLLIIIVMVKADPHLMEHWSRLAIHPTIPDSSSTFDLVFNNVIMIGIINVYIVLYSSKNIKMKQNATGNQGEPCGQSGNIEPVDSLA